MKHKAPNIFNREWDVLVILDACRVDSLEKQVRDRDNYGDVAEYLSVGANSATWLDAYEEKLKSDDIVYVSANPHTKPCLDSNGCVEVWKTNWDEGLGTVRAEDVTDAALYHYDPKPSNRLVVHYMQPHFPSVPQPQFNSGFDKKGVTGDNESNWSGSVWEQLNNGDVANEEVQEAYTENLKYVLDEVDVLTTFLSDCTVSVTADHGNSFTEPYGHPDRATSDAVRQVPWCYAEAIEDPKRHPKDIEMSSMDDKIDVEKRLSSLGYR
ncbi:hypothetical protein J2744_002558 [Halorubrum trapanicum]|uniref:Sulfatase n=1 Tax=Halorubrum trapanicum TaxID=29284 RepID=A0A8J7R901_9EURY|nr:hypothetical protein [Halorubrum trapanicum]MBP1902856.1 hypothetical protein [Halorubrum trapanicum]